MTDNKEADVQGFADRLNKVLADSPDFPEPNKGLQVELARRMQVSQEGARRWLIGESRPRPKKMNELAEILRVDPGWLAFGIEPLMTAPQTRRYRRASEGAVHYVFGSYMMDGYSCAFPDHGDEPFDFTAIKDGVMQNVHVSTGVEDDAYMRFEIPQDYERVRCLGVIKRGFAQADILHFPTDVIETYSKSHGEIHSLAIESQGNKYRVGDAEIKRLTRA